MGPGESWSSPAARTYALTLSHGTLVTGTDSPAGGWNGSFRGTLVAGKVRLERIDSQIGFAAIFYGRLVSAGSSSRLEGTWEGDTARQRSAGVGNLGR